ncbi:hypothetical protein C0Q64_23540 [Streptomyces albidoflavus]|uniref:hypothetical protein n=1 Tax=Streptomyces albidoflavus TaxID=1886 RepID=UPI00101E4876|nr:hypothetical protein [Streptomyces albidoflavus]RZD93264.1 hypothetical protein C0Q64_23540 [Streptomyces albidoflavus]RZD97716.1 hypothetical protein C0Q65_23765 [Streptomyces albidoflavus]
MGNQETGARNVIRVLPWKTPDGKECLLQSDDAGGVLSRLADDMEAAQLGIGEKVLLHAQELLSNPRATEPEMRYLARQLAECLGDSLRVAGSRGVRLGIDGTEDDEGDAGEGPELPAEAFG